MKTIFSLLIISTIALSAQAQFKKSTSFSYSISEPFEQFSDYEPEHYTIDDHIYSLRASGSFICIEKFGIDTDNLLKRTIVELDKGFIVKRILNIEDKFYVLFFKNEAHMDNKLYSMQLDILKGAFISETKQIGSIEADQESRDLNPGHIFKSPHLYTKILENGNIIICYEIYLSAVYNGSGFKEAKSLNKIRVIVLDNSLEVIKDSHFVYSSVTSKLLDIQITDQGKIFGTTKNFNPVDKQPIIGEKRVDFDWSIFEINISDNSKVDHSIKLDNTNTLTSLDIFITEKGEVYAGGGFSSREVINTTFKCYNGASQGFALFKLTNSDFKIYSEVQYSRELIKEYNPDGRRTESTMRGIELEQLYEGKDGAIYFMTACVHVRTGNYHFDDLVIGKLKKNGELDWTRKLPVQSVSSMENNLVYTSFMGETSIFTVLLDSPENAELEVNKMAIPHIDYYPGDIVAYKVSMEDGSAEKMILFNTEKVYKRKFYHLNVMNVNDNIVTFESYVKGDEDVFVKMKFEE
jgi:hypothetical protein